MQACIFTVVKVTSEIYIHTCILVLYMHVVYVIHHVVTRCACTRACIATARQQSSGILIVHSLQLELGMERC